MRLVKFLAAAAAALRRQLLSAQLQVRIDGSLMLYAADSTAACHVAVNQYNLVELDFVGKYFQHNNVI